jgi:penicillin-binding protein 1C
VLGRAEAYIISDILSDYSARAPAFGQDSAFNLPFDMAAKTGTTKDYRDNWAVGYTPDWTIGVWVGNFDGVPMRKVSGITGAAPVLKEVALEMKKLYGSGGFHRPPGVKTSRICPLSGLPVSPFCPTSMEEVFLSRDVLRGQCRAHDPAGEVVPGKISGKVEFPRDGDIFRIDPQSPLESQALFFSTLAEGRIVWVLDGKELPENGQKVSWGLVPGRHKVLFTAENGGKTFKSTPVVFSVFR